MNTKKQRAIALLICAVVLAVTLFSAFSAVKEANHQCVGEKCPICACIHTAEQALKQLGHSSVTCSVSAPSLTMLCLAISACALPMVLCTTLIGQKVRQNN
ncbi:MAG: hypothetical protein ACI4PM_04015 [Butyricicoccus sp.]